jgi:hypothetical protein
MTCIVGMVDKKDVVIGGDSAGVAGYSMAVRKDPKVFLKDGFLFGFTSSFRMGQLLQYTFKAPKQKAGVSDDTYLRTTWIDALRKCLTDGGCSQKVNNQESGGTFLLGYRSRLYIVDGDFQIGESHCGYDACGCGADIAKGAMCVSGKPAEERVRQSLFAAEFHSAGVRGPFNVLRLRGGK